MTRPKPPRSNDELERYLPYLVNRLSVLGQAKQNRILQKNGISLLTLRTLSVLQIEDGLTINEIAARTFTEQSSASRAIEVMVTQGLVERRIPQEDQRRREIVLTERGRKQLVESWPTMDGYYEALIAGTSAEEREACRLVLVQMLANLAKLES